MEDYIHPVIRLAKASDAARLKDLNDLFNDLDDTTLNELETSLRENNKEIIICADIGTAIIGVCCVQIINTMCFNWQYCFITELFVREEYRNHGIGKALMKFAETELIKRGIKKTFLWTLDSNEKALKLYKSLGFIEMTDTVMCMKEY